MSELEDEIVLLKLISGTKHDGERISKLQADLASLSRLFEPKPYIFEGLTEAVVNTLDHAYSSVGSSPEYPFAGHRWWATACFDPTNSSLRFFVYDQGIGIPKTIEQKRDWVLAIAPILSRLGLGTDDANIIHGALQVGESSTGLAERGKGLDQMHDVIRKAGAGHMRIVSGRGDLKLGYDKRVEKRSHRSHVGGTLIEWSIPYDAFSRAGAKRA